MSENAKQNFLNRVRVQKDLENAMDSVLNELANVEVLVSEIANLDQKDQQLVYNWCKSLRAC